MFAPEYESCGVSRRVMLSLRSISLVRCAILRRLRMTRGGALSVISPLPLRLRVKKIRSKAYATALFCFFQVVREAPAQASRSSAVAVLLASGTAEAASGIPSPAVIGPPLVA